MLCGLRFKSDALPVDLYVQVRDGRTGSKVANYL